MITDSFTAYQKQCLPATNFWRTRQGLLPIAILT